MRTLSKMLNTGDLEIKKGNAKYMIIEVQAFDNKPELIINPRENFDDKLYYYSNAYNEDLTLKANENIKITNYSFVEDVYDYFEKDELKDIGDKYLLLLAFDSLLLELDNNYEGVSDEQNNLIQSKIYENYGLSANSTNEEVSMIREHLINDTRKYRDNLMEEL